MEPVIYFNREFRPEKDATVSVRSRALNYGLGCFAGIRGYKSDDGSQVHVFRLNRHVRSWSSRRKSCGSGCPVPHRKPRTPSSSSCGETRCAATSTFVPSFSRTPASWRRCSTRTQARRRSSACRSADICHPIRLTCACPAGIACVKPPSQQEQKPPRDI